MFNGIVYCISSTCHSFMKPNRVYIFKNGVTIREDGMRSNDYSSFKELVNRNVWHQQLKLIKVNEK